MVLAMVLLDGVTVSLDGQANLVNLLFVRDNVQIAETACR